MFLKPFRSKSQTAIKGSDRKKLRVAVSKQYAIDDNVLSEIIPNKEEMTVMKLETHGGDTVQVYIISGDPAFFQMHFSIYPTVYTLWKYPDLLPAFTTWPPVFQKLLGGADLMLPGVIVKGPVTPNFMGKLPKGSPCAINLLGNKAPTAVGKTALSTADMYSSAMRGKGVIVLHTYTDHLWALGSKATPPQIDDPEVLQQESCEADDSGASRTAPTDSSSGDMVQQDGVCQAAESLEMMAVGGENIQGTATEEDLDGDPRSPQEKMDELLTWCFMCAIKSRVKKSDLPLLTSTFFRNHLQPCCPSGELVDVKKSSFKKLTKFLKSMQDRGYVKVKELSKGVESIIETHKDHPDIRELVVPDTEPGTKDVNPTQNAGAVFVPPTVQELFTVTAATLPLFKLSGHNKGSALTTGEIRKCLTDYVKDEKLQNDKKTGHVILDPILSDVVLQKGEYLDDVSWEQLITRTQGKMSPAYLLTVPGERGIVKKGKLDPISFLVEQRGGNKKVTLVHNLELYGIDPHEFGHRVQVGVACSVSVCERPGKHQGMEILIQGNQVNYVANLLLEKYNIPRKYVHGMEKAPKGKKRR